MGGVTPFSHKKLIFISELHILVTFEVKAMLPDLALSSVKTVQMSPSSLFNYSSILKTTILYGIIFYLLSFTFQLCRYMLTIQLGLI